MLNSAYPPSDELLVPETLERDISLQLCLGYSFDWVWDSFMEDPDDDPWQGRETDIEPVPDSLEQVISLVAAEYRRNVPEDSPHARALKQVPAALEEAGIAWSFGEGWDKGEAAHIGHEKAQDKGLKGYAYCTNQDAVDLIFEGTLFIGYSNEEGKATDAEIGRAVTEVLDRLGLNPTWDGNTGTRIECTGLTCEFALDESYSET